MTPRIGSFQTDVRFDNAVPRDHRVHGVRLVPGVTYVDMFYRMAASGGLAPEHIELHDLLFETPVVVSEEFDQRLRFLSISAQDGVRIQATASRLRGGEPTDETEHAVARCLVRRASGPPPAPLDVAACEQAVRSAGATPMESIYQKVERTGIAHRDFMRALGSVARSGDGLVARLSLGDTARRHAADFFLPPTFLDAATLVAFSELITEADCPYIPVLIGRVRAGNQPGDTVYLRTRPGGVRTRGDIAETSVCLYDEAGRPVAEFQKLTVKRVRHAGLIQKLATVPEDRREFIAADLRQLTAAAAGLPPAEIEPETGFYDLGLDSSDLLDLARTLEGRVGERLYPTLLFEYPTIAELAGYLVREFGDKYLRAEEQQHAADEVMAFGFEWQTSPPSAVPAKAASKASAADMLVFEDDEFRPNIPNDARVVRVRKGTEFQGADDEFVVDPTSAEDIDRLVRCLTDQDRSFKIVLYLWGYDAVLARREPVDLVLPEVLLPFRSLARSLADAGGLSPVLVACLPGDSELSRMCAAAIGGFARTARLEGAVPAMRSVLLDAAAAADVLGVAAAEALLDGPETEVRYAGGRRETRRLVPAAVPARRRVMEPGTVVLITGGLGGLARLAARRFAGYGARLVLTGRREPDAATAEFLRELTELGGQARYVPADVSVPGEAVRVVAAARRWFGDPQVVLHAAGALRDGLMRSGTPDAIAQVAAPKVAGTVHLERAVASGALECLVLFSSLSAVIGNPGQSDYAAASRFLDAYAEEAGARRSRGEHTYRTISVGWPLWRDGGMGVEPEQQAALRRAGFGLLPDDVGLDLLEAAMAGDRPYLAVVWGEPARLARLPEFAPAPAPGARAPEGGPLDIAVVGMAGRYPGASDVDEFWRNLESGHDAITEVPAERWTAGSYPAADGRPMSRFGGFLADVDKFDPEFFGIPPALASLIDPQERLFLETAYGAVENAGYAPHDFPATDNRVGVFAGATWGDYRLIGARAAQEGNPVAALSTPSSIANRVSYFFGFTGPSMTVDTLCSSSLTAVHLACASIAAGECTAAIAGGVNLLLHPDKYLLLANLGMTSADGRCRSFGARGDGYGPAEGVGAVFLKPLDRAVADGDTIHGVIRGSAVNHAGRSAGYTVPNPGAQADVITRALGQAQVHPDTIGYLEAHGTGTALGDPIEIAALRQAFGGRTTPCVLGSVKSSIGHAEPAAGIAALTRTVLQIRYGRITPSLHSAELNPEIDFAGSPFRVAQQTEQWHRPAGPGGVDPGGEVPRRAGISSFGAGGANAHLIIEEHIEPPAVELGAAELPAEPEILVLSARSAGRLREYAERMMRFLRRDDAGSFGHIARTLQDGRPALPERLALVARTAVAAADALERYLAGEPGAVITGTAGPADDAGPMVATYQAGDLQGAAGMWVRGAMPDWPALNGGPRRRVPLPGYPLERRRFWIDSPGEPVPSPSGYPGVLGEVDSAFRAALPSTNSELDRCQPALSRYAAIAVQHRFAEMGWPADGGTTQELRQRMGIADSFDRFFDACLDVLHRGGLIRRDGPVIRTAGAAAVDPPRMRAELLSRFPESGVYIRLLDVCLEAFPETLRGRKPATDVLFPHASLDLMAPLYRGNPSVDFYTEALAEYVTCAARLRAASGRRPVRILEAGTGTGSATHFVLAALAREGIETEYHCTDLGGSFVAHLRKTFGARYPFTRFGVYDMEKDPQAQGLAPGSFDMVLAVGAMHAVADIDRTLSQVRNLLGPGGLLALAEQVMANDALTVTIGLLDGWHRYTDPERRIPHSPLLSAEQWRAALERAGFDGYAAYGEGMSADARPGIKIIVAAGPAGQVPGLATPRATPADLEPALTRIVADCLDVNAAQIRPELPFADYGVDSIMAVAIIDRLNELLGLDLKPTVVYDHATLRDLAEHAARLAPPAAPVQAVPSVRRASPEPERERARSMDVAIIGMSGRFPGAADYRELWRVVAEGRDCVTEVPADRWSVAEHYRPLPAVPGKTYSRWGGYLSDADRFDPLFFGIVPAEADFMDPQQRLFLQESWRAIEDAGLDIRRLRRSKCGVFAGATMGDYLMLIRDRGQFGSHHVFTGISAAVLPARVAYHLDLTGPCLSVDTACSSSLVALHQACQSLAAGDCETALAGGVSIFATPAHHILASSLGMLSPQGRCKTFDDGADGFVIGEGVGVVVLKPLARALADGDPVHGVIKGIGVNSDGRTNGITAPSARSQSDLELEVYRRSGIRPETIGYVEAHGTGTRLGDPIEIEALTNAFRQYTGRNAFIPIGSVKTNIGHTSLAAGMASLFKVLRSMRAQQIPPSLHFTAPNQLIPFAETPFFVNTGLRAWPGPQRRAAVSAFGFSGTNCHLVVEDLPDRREPTRTRSHLALVPLSARTQESLRRTAQDLDRFLGDQPDVAVHDVAATLQLGRVPFGHRLAIVAGSVAELRERLALAVAGKPGDGVYRGSAASGEEQEAVIQLTPDVDLARIAQSWVTGASLDFAGLYDGGAVRRIHLPGYAFAQDRCWLPDTEPAGEEHDRETVLAHLKGVLARQGRLPVGTIDAHARLEDYGIESVMITKLTADLEEDFGTLPKTLFFEYRTLSELAAYLVRERPSRLTALADKQAEGRAGKQAPRPVPAAAGGPAATADIAVIGMAGRYPMAGNNDEFWANLMAARDCITEVPRDRWDHRGYLSEDPGEPGTTYARWGGFMDDVDRFDARFFGITPKDAQEMDPQQRLFLQTTWAAMEDGGYPPDRIIKSARRRGTKDAGVFAGVTFGEYQLIAGLPVAGYWAVPNRVSYQFGFNGPSFAVDTACSASLTAVHLACESLRRGECGYALAGGVNVSIHPGKFVLLGYGQWASSDGRCRTFGAGGDGYVPGEGVVALLLKPLADALEDGDRVHGVIRSSGVNHDGRTNGFSVPNPNAQADLVREVLACAGADARSVSYVEAHGTGTSLGDPIEVAALTKAYRDHTGDREFAVIGSAKSCIGHLEAAAGAAGVVKTLLQLEHETIPPSLHADPPNPNIDFAASPFRVALQAVPWPRRPDGPPRVATVSSFGAGGANAHLLLEEAPAVPRRTAEPQGPYPVLLSARNADRLAESARGLLAFLRSERGAATALADIAWTLMTGRQAFEHRLAMTAVTLADLTEGLDEFLAGGRERTQTGALSSGQRSLGESAPDRAYLDMLREHGDVSRLAGLWVQGWTIDWEALYGSAPGRIVSLPTYPFARDRHWIVPEDYRRRGGAERAEPPHPTAEAQPPGASLRDAVESDVVRIFAELTRQSPEELDVTSDFHDIGFDSVVTVRMLNQLMKRYGARIPATTIEDHRTIRSFSQHLTDSGLIAAPAANGQARPVPSSDRAPVTRSQTAEAARLTRERPFAADSIFVTGVTGVLGGKLLHDLLMETTVNVTCLVRGETLERATERIRYFLGVYDHEGRLATEFQRRVTPLLGDVSRPRLGLDDATWARLAADTDVIIHMAGKTTLVSFYEMLAPTNVDGTRRVVDLALATRQKYLIYLSSFSALGDYLYAANRPFSEQDLDVGQGYDHLPYQETKYRAEKLIRAASDEGLVWNIFRPGNIMGDATTGRYPFSEVSVKGVYYDIFKTLAETGIAMLTPVHWDISPVDYVSSGIVQLGLRRPSYFETYHLTNPDIRTLFDVSQHISDFGYDLRFLSIDEFGRWAEERLFRYRGTGRPFDSQTIEMVKHGIETWGRDHYLDRTPPDSTYTQGILRAAGITCPPVAELVPRYLEHCIEMNYLPPPPPRRSEQSRQEYAWSVPG